MLGELLQDGLDEARLNAVADLIVEISEQAAARGGLDRQAEEMDDNAFVSVVDTFASESHPMIERLQELLAKRGWVSCSRIERIDEP